MTGKTRRQVLMQPEWGKRPPLWWTMTAAQSATRWHRIEQLNGRVNLGWFGPTVGQAQAAAQAEMDRWPIAAELMYRLNRWAQNWERMEEALLLGGRGPEATSDQWEEWSADGVDLAVELQDQLGDNFEVWYYDRRTGTRAPI